MSQPLWAVRRSVSERCGSCWEMRACLLPMSLQLSFPSWNCPYMYPPDEQVSSGPGWIHLLRRCPCALSATVTFLRLAIVMISLVMVAAWRSRCLPPVKTSRSGALLKSAVKLECAVGAVDGRGPRSFCADLPVCCPCPLATATGALPVPASRWWRLVCPEMDGGRDLGEQKRTWKET